MLTSVGVMPALPPTVTAAVPATLPRVAVTVTAPFAAPESRPDELIVAAPLGIDVADQVTDEVMVWVVASE